MYGLGFLGLGLKVKAVWLRIFGFGVTGLEFKA